MYDKKRPYNDLPKLPPKHDFDDVVLLKLVNKANIALSSFNGTSKILPSRTVILEPLTVKEAVASSGVENINTTVSEVFRAELFPAEEATKPQKETLHYKDALVEGLRLVTRNGFLNTNNYIDLQGVLEPKKTGIRRKEQTKEPVRIENSVTGETIYTPPEGYDLICELLKNYEEYYNDFSNEDVIDPLIKLALLHYQFEAIHPFRDGNGRTGRILMVLYLVLAKRIDLPVLFLSGYILEHRDEYYRLLRGVTEEGKWKEWVMFILNAVIRQSKDTEETIMKIKTLMDAYKKMATKESLPNSSSFIDYMFSKPVYTYKDLSEKCDVHKNTAIKYLNDLSSKGVFKKTRFKKEAIFFYPEFIKLL
ncbi:hypothetical protein A2765_02375 [Candidatus Kaiserbacteria bacterium RIFCSPHIGHO2_01_FULL_56_24]|uniref:Fido domain-containing protein n=1 Tax=Candidatus Kaiserbacteria bacterium RIFCSPHIGHO2_01_FULL_56_24 TaxID=1798487 RepID=A0A1F6DB33_9BACT|nr:MAG: hypothetical protein A2765_02375 [Candidatus Kaiserbacteria bacterium RIFCSPHIGHO2_01_FULL_56_24]